MRARLAKIVISGIPLLLACGGDDGGAQGPSAAQYKDKTYGELTSAEQKQLCVDIKKGFAPLEQEIQQVYCTSVGINASEGDDVATCEARRDQCLDSSKDNARDPGCEEEDLDCDDYTRVDELITCFEAIKQRYHDLSGK